MSFSYTPGGATDLDDIRMATGDTDSAAPAAERLENEEIARLLTLYAPRQRAVVACFDALIAKLARRANDKTVGALRLVFQNRIDALIKLRNQFEANSAMIATPYCGGISVADVAAVDAETDRVTPSFNDGMLDNPRELGFDIPGTTR